MKPVKVVCGIIWKDGQVLIAKRKAEKSLGGYWEFPGGKIEADEEPEYALIRELKEELGMEVNNLRYFGTIIHEYESISIELIAYECDFRMATYELLDHDEVIFINPKTIIQHKAAPADLLFIDKLINIIS